MAGNDLVWETGDDLLELRIVHLLTEQPLDIVQGVCWVPVRARVGGHSDEACVFAKLDVRWRGLLALTVLDDVELLVDVDSHIAV